MQRAKNELGHFMPTSPTTGELGAKLIITETIGRGWSTATTSETLPDEELVNAQKTLAEVEADGLVIAGEVDMYVDALGQIDPVAVKFQRDYELKILKALEQAINTKGLDL